MFWTSRQTQVVICVRQQSVTSSASRQTVAGSSNLVVERTISWVSLRFADRVSLVDSQTGCAASSTGTRTPDPESSYIRGTAGCALSVHRAGVLAANRKAQIRVVRGDVLISSRASCTQTSQNSSVVIVVWTINRISLNFADGSI